MQLLFTLDYELFMGPRTGSVDNCLIRPLDLYLAATDNKLPFTLFVDAAYLHALKRLKGRHACLDDDYTKIARHLRQLHQKGHDIQLHIHPQWFYSSFNGTEWQLDTAHYKLADMEQSDRLKLVKEAKDLLDGIIGKHTTAFRAGGFSAQPTEMLATLFDACTLRADSSVCPGLRYDSPFQQYDFSSAQRQTAYRFEDNICQEQANGRFIECPISMHQAGASFHWRLAIVRLLDKFTKGTLHNTYGDGQSIPATRSSIMSRLLGTSSVMATIDGYKISFLKDAIDRHAQGGYGTMCILGHPKLATPYSVNKLHKVYTYARQMGHTCITLSEHMAKL